MSRPFFGRKVIFAAALIAGFLYGLPPSIDLSAMAETIHARIF